MEEREMPRMCKNGESKTTQIVMATVPHVTFGSGLRKFLADGFLLDLVYISGDFNFLLLLLHISVWLYHHQASTQSLVIALLVSFYIQWHRACFCHTGN
jgi:hypothetical protein